MPDSEPVPDMPPANAAGTSRTLNPARLADQLPWPQRKLPKGTSANIPKWRLHQSAFAPEQGRVAPEQGRVAPEQGRVFPEQGRPPPARDEDAIASASQRRASEINAPPTGIDDLPFPKVRSRSLTGLIFVLCVVLPTAAVAIYLFAFASNQYLAEFRFSVTETAPNFVAGPTGSTQAIGSTSSQATSASALLGGFSFSSGSPQNFVVVDYLRSRQALDELQKRINVREMYENPDIDWWQRFSKGESMERFADYFGKQIYAAYDPVTGLAIAQVKAFSAADALRVSETMVKMAEELLNSIALRPQLDAVRFAESEVTRAQERLKDVQDRLLAFRSSETLIDPSTGAVQPNVTLAQQLRATLIQYQTDLAILQDQKVDAKSTLLRGLVAKINATKEQLAKVDREVSMDSASHKALADVMGRFEKLDLDRQYAQASLLAARQAYDQARAISAAQYLYLTPYSRPVLPQSSTYPRRWLWTALSGAGFLGVWLLGLILYRSIEDHAF